LRLPLLGDGIFGRPVAKSDVERKLSLLVPGMVWRFDSSIGVDCRLGDARNELFESQSDISSLLPFNKTIVLSRILSARENTDSSPETVGIACFTRRTGVEPLDFPFVSLALIPFAIPLEEYCNGSQVLSSELLLEKYLLSWLQ
jgi:hypothetical protein